MKVLWAPWRMEYILADKEDQECIFCPGTDRTKDQERLILFVGTHTMVMMNRYPYNNGHLLVAPIKHVPSLDQLNNTELLALSLMVRHSIQAIKDLMNPDGFNVGINLGRVAGAGVEAHLHYHIVPRWNGDTSFMTAVGEVRVIPEHIVETYKKLAPYFKGIKDEPGGEK